ncbi:hypothetical protein Tco_1576240 [Tanacetum coccineum]
MTDQVANLDKEIQINKMVNESLSAELERYKKRVAIFEQRQNVDLNTREKLIDSKMDDIIRTKNAKLEAFKQEIDTLKETLSNNVKETESLSTTLTFHLKKAQRIKPTLYDGSVIAKEHVVISVTDDEETLILEEEKQAFWLKHSNHSSITPVVSHTPVKIKAPHKLPKIDNDQLLNQIMSQEIVHIAMNSVVNKSCVDVCNKCLELETELLKKNDFNEKVVYDKLVKSYSTLEQHCIFLEVATQLNQEIFQKRNFGENQNGPTFNQLFEINELKARSQEKDTVIRKLKDRIKSLMEKEGVKNVKKDIDEIETINIELEHSVAKLLSENENLRKEREHLKSIYKDQFDSIKKTRVFSIATSKNELRKIKGKNVVDTAISKPAVTTAPKMFNLNLEPLAPKLLRNKDVHMNYIKHSRDHANLIREIFKNSRALSPLDSNLDSACKYVQRMQEVLVYLRETCPCLSKHSEKLVVVIPLNKYKKVRFADPLTSSCHTQKAQDSNKPLLHSTRVIC